MKNTEAPVNTPLASRLSALQQAISTAADGRLIPRSAEVARAACGGGGLGGTKRSPAPKLIGVSKTHPVAAIEEVWAAGVTDFGENKVQEAAEKFPTLKTRHPDIRLHLIGPLQSNKVGEAVALFDVIHTIDRVKIADAIKAEMVKQNKRLTNLIQVNIGEEEQKAGVLPTGLEALLDHCRTIGLPISGLMCIPPADRNPAPYFALMQKLKQKHQLAELSMGMSGDFETAIRFGATMVRIGTALFGERNIA